MTRYYRGWRAKAARRMLKVKGRRLAHQGNCRLYALDGKAWLVSKRRVALLADWLEFKAHKRRIA